MAVKMGSFRYHFAEKSKERLLSYKGYSQLGLGITEGSDQETRYGCFRSLIDKIAKFWSGVLGFSVKAWHMGVSDPRKIIFSAKVGLALVLLSLLMFLKEPFRELSRHCVWAILTVVVVFEFSIGATLSKGLNRGLGTLSAGGLALAMAELAELSGKWEEAVVVISIFITGFCATYAKLYPTMKPYEYGFRVFLLTYCFIMISGYRTREFIDTAVSRFLLIALGAGVGFGINICIYPIWAGEDLHNLVAKNFMGVAVSLEGCVKRYLECVEYGRVSSKILTYQASDDPLYSGYRAAVESTSQEDALMGFAVWEPPHGPYKMFNYPWKDYVRVSGALRHCAFMVMALHGCILSEIQAPAEWRQVFSGELLRVGTGGAKVLRDLGNKVKKMEKLSPGDILLEIHEAAEELQKKIDRKSYILVNSESWEIGTRPKVLENLEDLDMNDNENKFLGIKSLSEAVLDLSSAPVSRSWDVRNTKTGINSLSVTGPSETMANKQISWPFHPSFNDDAVRTEEESKTYESASALSLATFSSLLIEFVARLQNLVDAFEELSEKARFKEPIDDPLAATEVVSFWTRLSRCFWFKS